MLKPHCTKVEKRLHWPCATLKIRFWISFHFQRRINVISTALHNVETTLIRRSNVGWVVSMKKLFLGIFCLQLY